MRSSRLFRLRSVRSKRCAVVLMLALVLYPVAPRYVETTVHAQQGTTTGIGNGFVLTAADLRFILQQIQVAQEHVVTQSPAHPCPLIGPGPNQVSDPQMPRGLRTVDGSCNNLVPVPDQHLFGAADRLFPRLTTPLFRSAEQASTYQQTTGNVFDSQPRIISNLIVDQKASNPAAAAVAIHPCGSGGFVCSDPPDGTLASVTDPDSGALFIPNITPDFGLSAPFNLMFAFFGQFFDHGLDLVTKGGNGNVIMPLQPDDPLYDPNLNGPDGQPNTGDEPPNMMVMTRAQLQAGPDHTPGTADDIHDSINETTPWVDQNQTYTSHPSHQVFLREYDMVSGRPVPNGKVLDGGFCGNRGGSTTDQICNIGDWAEVKAQARTKLGIQLVDSDVFNVPTIFTDPYGHFKPGANGFPQLVRPGGVLVEGNPAANGGLGVLVPDDALRTGHAFLNDIAHNAAPNPGLVADSPAQDALQPGGICTLPRPLLANTPTCQPAGTYDNELLDRHFITGDGRGNENIGLSMVHNLFHAEHNRLRFYIDGLISAPVNQPGPDGVLGTADDVNSTGLTATEVAAWKATDPGSGWGYGEHLFQASRFVTEMEYQHLVFEEFARTVQPLINPFLGGLTNIDAAISAEFAHTVYRLGHSMLPERLDRVNADGSDNEIRLLDAFLNPLEYNNGGPAGTLNADQAAGALINGLTKQIGNELDEFVTESVRNTLVGLPLDLPAINMARGRSEGIPPLNLARAQFFALTQDAAVQPYANWSEFGFGLRHSQSLANFLAAYGTDLRITNKPGPDGILGTADDLPTTLADKRAAATAIALNPLDAFLFQPAATSGLNNVDFWVGGLAEKPAVFGGLLGSTFNYVFELQLEHLQDGDRFYYLQRLDGTNLVQQLEGNSFAELARRNTNVGATMDVIFKTADFNIDAGDPTTFPSEPLAGITVLNQTDGTHVFFDANHTGKNITINGTSGNDRWKADVGDDTMFGNAGNDRLDGGEGNDTLIGGDGDDILFGGNGDDVLKGGPGDDALSSGPGFGGDLLIGGDGNDFMVGGNDGDEYFAGPGDDIIVDGSMRAELMQAGEGDDWIDDGEGHDGGMFGDEANNFDLLAGLNVTGGDDVEGGGPGQDNHWGFGGDDIYLMSEGSNKFFGDYGFDWITLRGWNAPEFIELGLAALPLVPVNFNDLRNRYRFVDGASGWNLNDHIAGSNHVLCDPAAAEFAECFIPGMELVRGKSPVDQPAKGVPGQVNKRGGFGARKIAGLEDLMTSFGPAGSLDAPAISVDGGPGVGVVLVKNVGFMGGDILLGGPGSDTLEGKGGDDLLDGDHWLNVQLRAVYNHPVPGVTDANGVRLVDSPRDLVADVFADPQLLNPGNISIVRSIMTPPAVPPDCGSATPLNCDTAVYTGLSTEFDITVTTVALPTPHTVTTIAHNRPRTPALTEGVDTLINMERAVFGDGVVVDVSGAGNSPATGTVTISDTTPTEDQVLTATPANIVDANGVGAITIQWSMETTPGVFTNVATGTTFTPNDVHVNHALRATARFTDGAGNAEAVSSAVTAAVANINDVPVGTPTVNQPLPQEGEAITASTVGISDADGLVGVTFGFQWQAAPATNAGVPTGPFQNIAGATAVSFTPTQAQVSGVLRVVATFTDNHGTAEAVTSGNTGVVGDLFNGTAANETFNGTAGRDNALGRGGSDTLIGAGGDDTLTGGNGDDVIRGGAGNDLIQFGVNDGFDDVDGGAGTDTIRATANGTVIGLSALSGVELIDGTNPATGLPFTNVTIQMVGGGGDDTFNLSTAAVNGVNGVTLANIAGISIDGGDGNDTIAGSPQADTISGGAGADTITGGAGADTITGGAGADVINGNQGNDDINGGAGNDTLTGGNGANIFRYSGANLGNDTITDFKASGAGQDLVNVNALGITAANFATRVSIAVVAGNTVATIRDATNAIIGTITFTGVTGVGTNQITIADFVFTP